MKNNARPVDAPADHQPLRTGSTSLRLKHRRLDDQAAHHAACFYLGTARSEHRVEAGMLAVKAREPAPHKFLGCVGMAEQARQLGR